MRYLYLHGFASGPQSAKAQFLHQRLQTRGIELQIPDLNQGDFTALTLTRQLHQAKDILQVPSEPWTVIGSSFGGLTGAWLGEQYPAQVKRLVLLAPAFEFLDQWLVRLGKGPLEQWQQTGRLDVYHYGLKHSASLDYGFVTDAKQYDETQLQQPVPTLILHGRYDTVISVEASQRYAATRPWVELVELESDHTLSNVQDEIWQTMQRYLRLN